MSASKKGLLSALAAIVLAMHGTAHAQATFTSTSGKVMTMGSYIGDLFVKWSESGLSTTTPTTYSISGTATATYACINNGSMCQVSTASPADLLDVSMTASGSGTIRQSVAVPQPGPGTSCSCSSGSMVLYQVAYGSAADPDMQICDDSNLVCAPIGSGFFSATFCKANSLRNCPAVP